MPFRDQMTPHALRRASQRKIPLDVIEEVFLHPDDDREATDPTNVVRSKRLPDGRIIEVVVADDAYTIVSVWDKSGE